MKSILSILFTLLLATPFMGQAQVKDNFTIKFNKYVFQPGDTLSIDAAYRIGTSNALPPATLEMIIENEGGSRTRLRWPLINGKISGDLVLPDSLPRGKYTIYMGVQPRSFQVVGKIKNGGKEGSLNAMLLTREGDWDSQEVPVEPDGTFAVRNWLFQNDGIIAFSKAKGGNNDLDIQISTFLDSSYEPVAVATRQIYFGTPVAGTPRIDSLGTKIQADDNRFFDRGELLPAVIVKAKTKTQAEQFDEAYASGLFKGGDARIISILDDPSAIAFPSVLAYLQGRVAGLQISNAGFNGGRAVWRGSPVSFYLDEVRVDAQQISSISMADVAIVKAFPPPFFGAPGGGSGGAIAVYTRRGGERSFLPANRSIFRIKGYTPLTVVLNMNKLAL